MSTYSWRLPDAAAAAPSPAPSSATSSSVRAFVGGLLDQEVDPVTKDFIDTANGAWSETPDSRSIVLCQIDLELGASYHTPGDGTTIAAMRQTGEPLTTGAVEVDLRRALGILVRDGVIADLEVNGRDEDGRQLVDEAGRAAFELRYRDLATGSIVDLVYRPTGG